MSNHKHTPTTARIKDDYRRSRVWESGNGSEAYEKEFDRWLAAELAAAEQRGAERALRELAKDAALVPAAPDKAAKFYRDRADRIADRLEGDDE